MRFDKKQYKFDKKQYKVGDEKWIRRFAFIPTRINENTIIWLETFYVRQTLIADHITDHGRTIVWFRWDDSELVLKEDYEYTMNLLDR